MKRRAQAAMEFLMTYGWAVLVVLLAIGALAYFGVLSPQKLLPERTTFSAPLPNLDNAVIDAGENSVEIAFKNNKGVSITIPSDGDSNVTFRGNLTEGTGVDCTFQNITGSYSGSQLDNDTSIPNGGTFLLKWTCEEADPVPESGAKFKADLTFYYTNDETGQTIGHTGTVDGKYP